MTALDILKNPFFQTILTSVVTKHSIDGGKWLMAAAAAHPWVRRCLPLIAAGLGFGLNLLGVYLTGGDLNAALSTTAPAAGLGSVVYHNLMQTPSA